MRKRLGAWGGAGVVGLGLLLAGCAVQPPSAPTVMALPAPGKSLAAFQQDDYACRVYAQRYVAYPAASAQASSPTANGAVLGALGGAALGAALGAVAGNAGAGAAIGGATGLLGGASVGSSRAAGTQYSLQQQYNIAYTQCMYAHGDSVRSPPPGYSYSRAGYPAAYPYGPYAYAPGFVGSGVLVFGGGRGHRWHHGYRHHGDWHH